jgi:3-deoxy-manno-octulosonate cytidylyltransferase (CMP-KDO synthetase)
MKVLGVIPARYASGRMPGKPLADICGKPMIYWVYNAANKSELLDDIVVATDDNRILDVCRTMNIPAIMTKRNHDTPTSRLYEVSTKLNADLYLMIMGDEPLINAESFRLIIPEKIMNPYIAVLTNIIDKPSEVIDFTNQKCVTNLDGHIMFISRSPIPYPKGNLDFDYEKVTGVQLFSKDALSFYNATPKSMLEKAEENDLMRFIENGIPVTAIRSPYKTISVDMPKDLEVIREIIKEQENNGKK